MGLMVVCGAMVIVGLAAAVRWRRVAFVAPARAEPLTPGALGRMVAWYYSILLLAGIGAGLTIIGGGGRLAMRLLAVTAGDDAQGRITEADEVVGEITVDGTIGFVLFNGILGGVAGAAIYLVVRRLLPAGALGGALFGVGLLAVLGATIDPLRKDNPDFDLVGPGWLAVIVFGAMAIAFGATLAAVAARASAWLPMLSADRAVLVRYAAPAALAALAFSVTFIVFAAFVLLLLLTRARPILGALRSRRLVVATRLAAGVIVLLSIPNFVSSAIDIVGRGG